MATRDVLCRCGIATQQRATAAHTRRTARAVRRPRLSQESTATHDTLVRSVFAMHRFDDSRIESA
ncbi:hypothetical protein DID96_22355 [Burkholderia sp. Bp8963]|nr:hypothetical protein DID96_22355 [Burkholderia sp. Bp8963]